MTHGGSFLEVLVERFPFSVLTILVLFALMSPGAKCFLHGEKL